MDHVDFRPLCRKRRLEQPLRPLVGREHATWGRGRGPGAPERRARDSVHGRECGRSHAGTIDSGAGRNDCPSESSDWRRRRDRAVLHGCAPDETSASATVARGRMSFNGSSSRGSAPKRPYQHATSLFFASIASATPPTSAATATARSPAARSRSLPSPRPCADRSTAKRPRRKTGTSWRPSLLVNVAGTRENSMAPGLIV